MKPKAPWFEGEAGSGSDCTYVEHGVRVTPGIPRDHPGSPGGSPDGGERRRPYAHPPERERQYLVDVVRVSAPPTPVSHRELLQTPKILSGYRERQSFLFTSSWTNQLDSPFLHEMSGDASLPPNAPMANGVHGEADASTTLSEVSFDMHSRVSAFLSASPKSDAMRRTQEQTRISLSVIEKALQDYE